MNPQNWTASPTMSRASEVYIAAVKNARWATKRSVNPKSTVRATLLLPLRKITTPWYTMNSRRMTMASWEITYTVSMNVARATDFRVARIGAAPALVPVVGGRFGRGLGSPQAAQDVAPGEDQVRCELQGCVHESRPRARFPGPSPHPTGVMRATVAVPALRNKLTARRRNPKPMYLSRLLPTILLFLNA